MPNYDGEYQVTIHYSCTPSGQPALQHTMTFDVAVDGTPAVGTPFASVMVLRKGGGTVDLENWIDSTWMGLLLPLFSNTTEFQYAQLDYIPEGTFAATTISNHLLGITGSSASPAIAAQASVITFKSIDGHLMKLYLMETINASVIRDPYPVSGVGYTTLVNYVVSDASPIVARDNSYVNLVIALSPGQNEALFKKRYRL